MKILSGWYPPDGGEVVYRGRPVEIPGSQAALALGISTVYQELMLCENLSVAENIFLGRETRRGGGIDWRAMHAATRDLLVPFGVRIDPRSTVKRLTIAERQIVEIAKAISHRAELLILDEPTSSLTVKETRVLFESLRRLKAQGVTILFISHRLDEVFEITDRISVLRDGRYLGTFPVGEVSRHDVVSLIAGKDLLKEIADLDPGRACGCPEVLLEVDGLSRGRFFRDVSFRLHRRELLGFYGLQGAGRTELMETLFGLFRPDRGGLRLEGAPVSLRSPREAIRRGFAFIPEDRRRLGLFANMDVKDNLAVIHDRRITALSFLRRASIMALAREYVAKLGIRVTSVLQRMKNLSGGNQQKVIIGRGLSTDPRILIMDEPTRGIDVGAKAEIFRLLRQLKTEAGKSIILVSSELEEVVAECDRVIVMYQGRIAGEAAGPGLTKERILHLAFGGEKGEPA